jgi:hypothetical protein
MFAAARGSPSSVSRYNGSMSSNALHIVSAGPFGFSADTWTAIGTWALVLVGLVTALVAGFAAKFAYGAAKDQLGEAQRLRIEQAQPYVVVFLDQSGGASPQNFDLVVKNFGATAATDVRVRMAPAPISVVLTDAPDPQAHEFADIEIPEVIPVLVPGQEWRTFWDATVDRLGKLKEVEPFEDKYDVTVSFSDSKHQLSAEYSYVLDWKTIYATGFVNKSGIHDIAEAAEKISRVLSDARGNQNAIRIESRNGDELDAWKLHLRRERKRKARIEGDNASRIDKAIDGAEERWKRLKRRLDR